MRNAKALRRRLLGYAGAALLAFTATASADSYADISIGGQSVACPLCGTGIGFGTPVVDGDIRVQSVMARLSVLFGR
jgi:hypothetical protein